MLDIGINELLDSDVNDDSGTARILLSGNRFYNEPLDADSIDDLMSSHLGCDLIVVRVVARKHPHSDGDWNSTSLNIGNDIVGETPRHHERGASGACVVVRKHPKSEGGCHSTSLKVGNDIGGETPRYQESDFLDICVMADKTPVMSSS